MLAASARTSSVLVEMTFADPVERAGDAERAGMERESLHRLLRRYGVRCDDFKGPA